MENQEPQSSWDDLARELGAEITPDVERREQAAMSKPAPPVPKRTEEPVPISRALPPKKEAADWNELASELGLPPLPPEETPAPPPKPPRPAAREEVRREPPRREQREQEGEVDRPRREQSRGGDSRRDDSRGSRSRRDERPPRAREEGDRDERPPRVREESDQGDRGERAEEDVREKPASREDRGERSRRGGRGRGRGRGDDRGRSEGRGDDRGRRDRNEDRGRAERPRPAREFDAESDADREVRPATDEVQEVKAERRPEPPAPVREEPPKPAAVSLWHKIFGSPAEQTARLVDEPEPADASEPIEYRDEPRDAGGFADAHAGEATAEDFGEPYRNRDEQDREPEEGESGDRPRGRSRRRRGRGGRGRRPESKSSEGRTRPEGRPARSQPVRDSSDNRVADDEFEDDLDDDAGLGDLGPDLDDEDDGDEVGVGAERGRSTLQRAIPSWDEAIGFIVDTNMQTRSQRRPPPRGGPRDNGGGGRGRSRGRRKS